MKISVKLCSNWRAKISMQQKLFRIADWEQNRWVVVKHHMSDEHVSDSEDEKAIERARKAVIYSINKRKTKNGFELQSSPRPDHRSSLDSKNRGSSQSTTNNRLNHVIKNISYVTGPKLSQAVEKSISFWDRKNLIKTFLRNKLTEFSIFSWILYFSAVILYPSTLQNCLQGSQTSSSPEKSCNFGIQPKPCKYLVIKTKSIKIL